jgi:hypothetical protein
MMKALFSVMLDRLGVIRQKTSRAPLLNPSSQFDLDVVETVAFHKWRMGIDRRIDSNDDALGRQRYERAPPSRRALAPRPGATRPLG